MFNKAFAEFLGAYILVFAGTGAIVINAIRPDSPLGHVGIALTFGLVVMAVIYAIGDFSGAHINPAVTIAFAISGRFAWNQVLPYCVAQFLGGLLASLTLYLLFAGDPNLGALGANLPSGSQQQSFVLEFILTAILMFVILGSSKAGKAEGILAGLAIGGTVALEALFAGPICGASMNPARSLAPALVSWHPEALASLWLYLVATTAGAAAAVPLCGLTHPDCCGSNACPA